MESIINSQYLLTQLLVQFMKICRKPKDFHVLRGISRAFSAIIDPNFMKMNCDFSIIGNIEDVKEIFQMWKLDNDDKCHSYLCSTSRTFNLYKKVSSNNELRIDSGWWSHLLPHMISSYIVISKAYVVHNSTMKCILSHFMNHKIRTMTTKDIFSIETYGVSEIETPEGQHIGIVKPFIVSSSRLTGPIIPITTDNRTSSLRHQMDTRKNIKTQENRYSIYDKNYKTKSRTSSHVKRPISIKYHRR